MECDRPYRIGDKLLVNQALFAISNHFNYTSKCMNHGVIIIIATFRLITIFVNRAKSNVHRQYISFYSEYVFWCYRSVPWSVQLPREQKRSATARLWIGSTSIDPVAIFSTNTKLQRRLKAKRK